jgi:hypothetical protein
VPGFRTSPVDSFGRKYVGFRDPDFGGFSFVRVIEIIEKSYGFYTEEGCIVREWARCIF